MKKDKKTFQQMAELFIPLFLEFLLITLLSSVDTLMLSRYNQLCVNAVGTAQTTLSLLTSLIIISSNGVAIIVGQFLGAKKHEDAKKVLAQGILFNFLLGLILFFVFFFAAGPLLKLANAKETFFDYAKTYIQIYSIALPMQAITQVIGADFRAHQKPGYMTIISVLSNLINVGLNALLIYGWGPFPELGIKGAAIATTISLGFKTVSAIILELKIIKDPIIPKKIDKNILLGIVKIGGPSALETVAYTIFAFAMTAALNKLSDVEIGSRAYINMVLNYTMVVSNALASTNSILVARYVGAHNYKEAKALTLKTALVGISAMVVLVGIINIFGRPLFKAISGEDVYVETIVKVLPLLFLVEVGRATNLVIIQAQKSSGDVLFPLILGLVSMSTMMAGGSWLFSQVFQMRLAGIILAQALDEFLRGIVSFIRWMTNRWMNHSLVKEESKAPSPEEAISQE